MLMSHQCLRATFSFVAKKEKTPGDRVCRHKNIFNTNILSLLFQSHLKEIQVAFISVLSDPDGKKKLPPNPTVGLVRYYLTPAHAN